MKPLILMGFVLALVACASQSGRQAELTSSFAASDTFVSDPTLAKPALGEVEAVRIEDFPEDRVCEKRKRPGSNIVQTVCYPLDQHLAQEGSRDEATREQLYEFEREARWRDEMIRQAQMEGRRPSGFGIGPH